MDTPPDQGSLKGRKRFELAYPWATLALPDPGAVEEQVLQPGDVLYLPAGCWHEVAAEKHSLAITIGFDRLPLHTIVARRLEQLLVERTAWRRTPPPLFVNGDVARDVDRFATDCADRAVELQAVLGQLTASDLVACAYPEVVSVDDPEAPSGPGTPTQATAPPLLPADRLVARHPLQWSPGTDELGAYALLLSSPYATASLGLEAFVLVDRLVQERSFKAADAMSWSVSAGGLSWEETEATLAGLVANGLLEVVRD